MLVYCLLTLARAFGVFLFLMTIRNHSHSDDDDDDDVHDCEIECLDIIG